MKLENILMLLIGGGLFIAGAFLDVTIAGLPEGLGLDAIGLMLILIGLGVRL